jgi:hypothetical protein
LGVQRTWKGQRIHSFVIFMSLYDLSTLEKLGKTSKVCGSRVFEYKGRNLQINNYIAQDFINFVKTFPEGLEIARTYLRLKGK